MIYSKLSGDTSSYTFLGGLLKVMVNESLVASRVPLQGNGKGKARELTGHVDTGRQAPKETS